MSRSATYMASGRVTCTRRHTSNRLLLTLETFQCMDLRKASHGADFLQEATIVSRQHHHCNPDLEIITSHHSECLQGASDSVGTKSSLQCRILKWFIFAVPKRATGLSLQTRSCIPSKEHLVKETSSSSWPQYTSFNPPTVEERFEPASHFQDSYDFHDSFNILQLSWAHSAPSLHHILLRFLRCFVHHFCTILLSSLHSNVSLHCTSAIFQCSRSHVFAADFGEPLFIQHEQNGRGLFQGIWRRLAELPRTRHMSYHTLPLETRLKDTTHGRFEPYYIFFHAWTCDS